MQRILGGALCALLLVLAGSRVAHTQQLPLTPQLLEKIPPDLREQAAAKLHLDAQWQNSWQKMSTPELRRRVLSQLALMQDRQTLLFVLDKLASEQSEVKFGLLTYLRLSSKHWSEVPGVDDALLKIASDEKDDSVAIRASQVLMAIEARRLRGLLNQRHGTDRELAQEDERLMLVERNAQLPEFLRTPPPVFSLKPAESSVRVVGFGDFGTGSLEQKRVAAAIAEIHRREPFDFGITFGDNFYTEGMVSPDDPRWQEWWEKLYGPLGIPFLPALGNHDWYLPDSPAAQVLYSQKSSSWRLPAPYYSYRAGAVQFFVVETGDISRAQEQWLRQALGESEATWKIVYGHHPIELATPAHMASTFNDSYTEHTREHLLPLMQGKVDAYFAGHHHSMEHLKAVGGVEMFVSGVGGNKVYPVEDKDPRALFALAEYGFTVIEADSRSLVVNYYDAGAALRYRYEMRKE